MQITMKKTARGKDDHPGAEVRVYEAGESPEVGPSLGAAFIGAGLAFEGTEAPADGEDSAEDEKGRGTAAPKNKARSGLPENK